MASLIKTRLAMMQNHNFFGPAAMLFISANIANGANLAFNMIFARLMGPAAFADLTLLLTLKLGILSFLGALQFAFAENTARESRLQVNKSNAYALSWRSLRISVPIMFVVIASANFISAALNFPSPSALCILALAIPFFLPMVIYRGLVQGLIDVPKIILSIQSEWVIRLIGSVMLWQMGFGLAGIALAVGLSIIAGFIFCVDRQDGPLARASTKPPTTLNAKALGVTAMPYLTLQAAQVLVLDSDIIIAKAILSPETAGLVAGLLLIQRVFFFAFLSCSTILQPYVARQQGEGGSPKELLTLLAAIATITAIALTLIIPNPGLVVKVMLGDNYAALSSIVWISALTGAVFIVSHLCAIYHIANGQKFAAKIVLGFGVMQLIVLGVVNHLFPEISLYYYFIIKLMIQILCAASLLGTLMLPPMLLRQKMATQR